MPLRQEVAHRTIQGARHADRHAIDCDQREGAVDRTDVRGIAAEHAAPPLVERHVVDLIQPGIEQVDDAFYGARHPGIVKPSCLSVANSQLVQEAPHARPPVSRNSYEDRQDKPTRNPH